LPLTVQIILENLGHIVLMLALLCCSGFFSGSETAFFNLSPRQKRLLGESRGRVQKLVVRLLDRPVALMNSLLFGNMAVNVLYFAISSVLSVKLKQQVGYTAAAAAALCSFMVLVLLGEVVPKSLAYANSRGISLAAALPAFAWVRVFAPLQFVFNSLILEPALRLLLGPAREPGPLTAAEFRSLVETIRRQGLISADENKLLTEVIELGFLKVRHVMRPRVDMAICAVTDSPSRAAELMRSRGLTKLPVYAGKVDHIVGLVRLRRILLEPGRTLDKLVEPVHFVPEQKTVESLLEFFRGSRTDTAVVVDEYGGIAGLVRLEDIAEELFGQIELSGAAEPIEQIGPFEYRLAGNLGIHDCAEAFGIDANDTRICTVGGLVTALLGKIPQAGDTTSLKNLKFTVESVRRNRIESLKLTLEGPENDGK